MVQTVHFVLFRPKRTLERHRGGRSSSAPGSTSPVYRWRPRKGRAHGQAQLPLANLAPRRNKRRPGVPIPRYWAPGEANCTITLHYFHSLAFFFASLPVQRRGVNLAPFRPTGKLKTRVFSAPVARSPDDSRSLTQNGGCSTSYQVTSYRQFSLDFL